MGVYGILPAIIQRAIWRSSPPRARFRALYGASDEDFGRQGDLRGERWSEADLRYVAIPCAQR